MHDFTNALDANSKHIRMIRSDITSHYINIGSRQRTQHISDMAQASSSQASSPSAERPWPPSSMAAAKEPTIRPFFWWHHKKHIDLTWPNQHIPTTPPNSIPVQPLDICLGVCREKRKRTQQRHHKLMTQCQEETHGICEETMEYGHFKKERKQTQAQAIAFGEILGEKLADANASAEDWKEIQEADWSRLDQHFCSTEDWKSALKERLAEARAKAWATHGQRQEQKRAWAEGRLEDRMKTNREKIKAKAKEPGRLL